MTIEKLSECKNASKYGTCTECGASESESHNLYRLKFNGVSACLCQDCFSKARKTINRCYNVIIIPEGATREQAFEAVFGIGMMMAGLKNMDWWKATYYEKESEE